MTFDWYILFNKTEFEALGLISKTIFLRLGDLGVKEILITKGLHLGVTIDGTFLAVDMNGQNPFVFDSKSIYLDSNNDVWLGLEAV